MSRHLRNAVIWPLIHRVSSIVTPWGLTAARVRRLRRSVRQRGAMTSATRIFVDVTMIARHDAKTGIQRVVRSVFDAMRDGGGDHMVQPVRFTAGRFRVSVWPDKDEGLGEVMDLRSDDVFLGLDLSFDPIRRAKRDLLRQRRAGARIWFVVYDLLPLRVPEFFSAKVAARFRWWLGATAEIADGYACISSTTADELALTLRERLGLVDQPVVATIPMGFGRFPQASVDDRVARAEAGRDRAMVLAVGTIEPRKGYDEVLDAFEVLWADGWDAALTIVGSPGWKTDALQSRICKHREYGGRLIWEKALDDSRLGSLYASAQMLLLSSHGEGFGLPILEAVAHGCPVLARDIPIFQASRRLGIRYFARDADARQLADAIATMLRPGQVQAAGLTQALPDWRDTAAALLALIAADTKAWPS